VGEYMDATDRKVIKKYEYAQVNLVTDSSGNRFIEKIQFHKSPVVLLTFQNSRNGLEIIDSIIKPLEIPHPKIVDSIQNEKSTTFIMDCIEGINCGGEPKAKYLYIAAEKIGTIYNKSKMNISQLEKDIVEKYTLNKEKILEYIKVISKYYKMPTMDSLIDYIFEKYKNKIIFVNHHDMQFKNFIYNGDLHLIDWDNVKIHPFYSDLYSLYNKRMK
jgi:hypothetical protein